MRNSRHDPFLIIAAAMGLVCASSVVSSEKAILGLSAGLSIFGATYGYLNKEFPPNSYLFCSVISGASSIMSYFIENQKLIDSSFIMAVGFVGAELGRFFQEEKKQLVPLR